MKFLFSELYFNIVLLSLSISPNRSVPSKMLY